MGELFPQIDKSRTIANVRSFFKREDCYQRIRRRAWLDGIKSPQVDVTGIHGSRKSNASEDAMINYAQYANAKRAVDTAIGGCSNSGKYPSQDIMKLRYIDQLTVREVKDTLNKKHGHSTYQMADDQACYEFAECIDSVAKVMHVDRKLIPKMLVRKSGTKSGRKWEINGTKSGQNREENRT